MFSPSAFSSCAPSCFPPPTPIPILTICTPISPLFATHILTTTSLCSPYHFPHPCSCPPSPSLPCLPPSLCFPSPSSPSPPPFSILIIPTHVPLLCTPYTHILFPFSSMPIPMFYIPRYPTLTPMFSFPISPTPTPSPMFPFPISFTP